MIFEKVNFLDFQKTHLFPESQEVRIRYHPIVYWMVHYNIIHIHYLLIAKHCKQIVICIQCINHGGVFLIYFSLHSETNSSYRYSNKNTRLSTLFCENFTVPQFELQPFMKQISKPCQLHYHCKSFYVLIFSHFVCQTIWIKHPQGMSDKQQLYSEISLFISLANKRTMDPSNQC